MEIIFVFLQNVYGLKFFAFLSFEVFVFVFVFLNLPSDVFTFASPPFYYYALFALKLPLRYEAKIFACCFGNFLWLFRLAPHHC